MMRLVKLFSRILAYLPLSLALAIGRGAGWVFGSLVRHHRRDAFDALRRSLPEKSESEIRAIVKRMYSNLGASAVETLRLPYVDQTYFDRQIEWKHMERLERVLQDGRGALVLSAHLDNWELFSIVAPRYIPAPCHVIVKKIKNRLGEAYMTWNREVFGLNMLPAKNSYRLCMRALKRNEEIGFVIDQNMIRREGEFVDFFGRPACTTLGLAHLAARAGTPVIPIIPVRRDDGVHEISVMEPLDPPVSSEKQDLIDATRNYNQVIEDAIRAHPDQWIWIHRRWKTSEADTC